MHTLYERNIMFDNTTRQAFILDGITGYIYTSGMVVWATITCSYTSLTDCGLKQAIDEQCNIKSEIVLK